MSKRFSLYFIAGILGLAVLSAQAQISAPKSPNRLLLILDASGSMWGQIGGENKIVIARRVMKNLVNKLGADTNLGLVAYGHRREKDCEDIEIITPLAVLHKAALTQQIDALNPKGMTPITGAIRKAFEAVSAAPGATTIVLFSDGLETCGGDPCQIVSKAKAGGANFVMHVIGFDVGKENVAQLECAAQAGGGLYLSAENADELTAAFERAVAPADPSNAFLSIKVVANNELIDAHVYVFPRGAHKDVANGRTYTAASTNPRLLPIMAGEYDIEVRAINFKGEATQRFTGVKIAPGDTMKKIVDFGVGELAVKVTRNGKLSDAVINVLAAGTKTAVATSRSYTDAKNNPKVFQITPGNYDVVIKSIEFSGEVEKKIEGVVVKSGARSDHAYEFSSGTLRLGAISAGALVDATVQIVDAVSGATVAQGRTYTSANSNPKTFELSPGRYRVTAKTIKSKAAKSLEVTIVAGKVTEHVMDWAK